MKSVVNEKLVTHLVAESVVHFVGPDQRLARPRTETEKIRREPLELF